MQRVALAVTRGIGSLPSLILHTIFFASNFVAVGLGIISFDQMLLVLTMVVSLEAIYLSIFIQMSINYANESIQQVEQDIDEIQEDVEEMAEDMEEIAEDVEEIAEDVDDIQEEMEDITEEDTKEEAREKDHTAALASIQLDLRRLMDDIERLKASERKE